MKINAERVIALRTKRAWSQDELSIASAGSSFGQSDRMIAIFEREKKA
jgi:hypothetical protein